MRKIVLAYEGNQQMANAIRLGLSCPLGQFEMRRFPDGETYVRLITDVLDCEVIIVATLHRPDDKFLSLVFLLRLLKDAGARKIIEQYSDDVATVLFPEGSIDIDTENDYEELIQKK